MQNNFPENLMQDWIRKMKVGMQGHELSAYFKLGPVTGLACV
jgi:hypothetical protein